MPAYPSHPTTTINEQPETSGATAEVQQKEGHPLVLGLVGLVIYVFIGLFSLGLGWLI